MFDEPHFAFAVMETDPVTHMVGIIVMTETRRQKWFDITGEGKRTHTRAQTVCCWAEYWFEAVSVPLQKKRINFKLWQKYKPRQNEGNDLLKKTKDRY